MPLNALEPLRNDAIAPDLYAQPNNMYLLKLKEIVLDTPEGHWLIIMGYHIHKAFWGTLFSSLGAALIIITGAWLYIIACIFGALLIVSDVVGHIYTNHRPYFVLVEKYNKKSKT